MHSLASGVLSRRRAGATPRSTQRGRKQRVPFYLRTLTADHGRLVSRVTIAILLILLVLLQVRLWTGDGGMRDIWHLKYEIARQQQENEGLRERNEALEAEVEDLKQGEAAVEERARAELGMIRQDETFFQTVEP
jgi:cell division protein FtsB